MNSRLGRQLWDIYEDLRTNNRVGFLTDEDFQKYYLGFISYKYLSENLELYLDKELERDKISFEEAYEMDRYKRFLEREAIFNLGYFIRPHHLFRNIISSNNYGKIILREVEMAFNEISNSSIGTESQEDFENLFENVNLDASGLGKTIEEKNKVIFNIMESLEGVDFGLNEFNSSISTKYSFSTFDGFSEDISVVKSNFKSINEFSDEAYINANRNMFLDREHINPDEMNINQKAAVLNISSEESVNEDSLLKDYSIDQMADDAKLIDENDLSEKNSLFNENGDFDINNLKRDDELSYENYIIKNQYSIGDAFEYLLDKFSFHSSRPDDFYTPNDVSLLISKIVSSSKTELNAVYDPCCGSASLLLELNKNVPCKLICGQELNAYYYNVARENMILHNIHFKDFDIKQGDSLENPQHVYYEKFDAVVSQMPFNVKWTGKKSFLEDPRFREFNILAPRVKAEYAFIQHMLYHLADDGIMVIIVPHGVLFRAAAEGSIRKIIVGKMNYLDAVIGLPSNMFYSTNSPSCMLIFKKNRKFNDDVLFIDASKDFNKIKLRNNLRIEDINKIVSTYINRLEIDKYSHKADLSEIIDNDFNLNIPRYVDTFEEKSINRDDIYRRREEVSKELIEVTREIDNLCKELNIDNPLINDN